MGRTVEDRKLIASVHSVMNQCALFTEILSETQYRDKSHLPFKSSIGEHCRHVIEIFEAVFRALDSDIDFVDFSYRERKVILSEDPDYAKQFLLILSSKLDNLSTTDLSRTIKVKDNLGQGILCQESTVGSCLMFACNHAIHHFAQLKTMAFNLGISLDDNKDFGYNPTTPK